MHLKRQSLLILVLQDHGYVCLCSKLFFSNSKSFGFKFLNYDELLKAKIGDLRLKRYHFNILEKHIQENKW